MNLNISCIIPTCDRPDLLIEAVDSVFKQTSRPYEIIVVNNGRKSLGLPQEITKMITVYDLIPYIGVAQARNFGASLARGEYLAFLDDDDLWNPKYLEQVVGAIEQGALCIVSRLDQLKNGQIFPFKNAHNKITMENILYYNPGITGSNIVISKKLFFDLGGFDPKLPPSEDKSLLLEVLKAKIEPKTLPDNQAIIRFHAADRLSDAKKIAEGIYQFTRKYAELMNRQQYFANWLKIYRYRYESGQRSALLPFILLYLANKIGKLWR